MKILRPHFVVFVAAIVLTVGISIYVFARPSPTLAPLSLRTTTNAPALSVATTTTQPKITWSATSTELLLSPGKNTARDFIFTSSAVLKNITIEAVPAIARFITIQPGTVARLAAGQGQSVHIAFAAPAQQTPGTYLGSIHIKDATQTYPQTMKVVIDVAGIGAAIFLPPDPGSAGKTTLQGIDSDADGIRDDLERYIDLTSPSSAKTRAALDQLVVQAQMTLIDSDDTAAANLHTRESLRAINCLSFIVGSDASAHIYAGLRAQLLNTMPRSLAWIKSAKAFSGQVVRGMVDRKAGCDFDPDLMEN